MEDPVFFYEELSDPSRVVVTAADDRRLAVFTLGAHTVLLHGEERTFTEVSCEESVTTSDWVRVLSEPSSGVVDEGWLSEAMNDKSPDVLALAMQYLKSSCCVFDADGLLIAGDAAYGPLDPDGIAACRPGQAIREEGSDFYDYLGIPWTFPDKLVQPDKRLFRCLDCSGYIRMLWGYRAGLPLVRGKSDGTALPRTSFQLLDKAPGVVTIPATGTQVTDLSRLATGDLVFFDRDADDGTRIDHLGMYLGVDSAGHHRFISSRKNANGPTMGDFRGRSILDGNGSFAKAFRAARRL